LRKIPILFFSRGSFLKAGNKRIGLPAKMFPMNKLEALDIEEEEDFKLAEILYKMNQDDDR